MDAHNPQNILGTYPTALNCIQFPEVVERGFKFHLPVLIDTSNSPVSMYVHTHTQQDDVNVLQQEDYEGHV